MGNIHTCFMNEYSTIWGNEQNARLSIRTFHEEKCILNEACDTGNDHIWVFTRIPLVMTTVT